MRNSIVCAVESLRKLNNIVPDCNEPFPGTGCSDSQICNVSVDFIPNV
jgi:hypothetical protein